MKRFQFLLRTAALALLIAAAAQAVSAQTPQAPAAAKAPPAPSETVEAEPIRCWWRTSLGAVRTGETFSLVLTCAVLENEQVQIVPDESRLGSAVVQLAPFDIFGGSHPADLHTANRRFFQYEYVLRMINPDFIGKDVPIPELAMHFRVNSKMSGNAQLQGRDFVYQLPPQSIRILGMVPGDAADIRDSSNQTFTDIESLRFRASLLRIVAVTLMVVGALAALLSLAQLLRRRVRKTGKDAFAIGDASVLRAVGRELTDIQRQADHGWTPELAGRATAMARIVAGYAMGRPVTQQLVESDVESGEGQLTLPARRGMATAVWSSVTPKDTAAHVVNRRAAAASKPMVEGLQEALSTFTVAGYSQEGTLDRSALDAALARVTEAASTLKRRYGWPQSMFNQWFDRSHNKGPAGRT